MFAFISAHIFVLVFVSFSFPFSAWAECYPGVEEQQRREYEERFPTDHICYIYPSIWKSFGYTFEQCLTWEWEWIPPCLRSVNQESVKEKVKPLSDNSSQSSQESNHTTTESSEPSYSPRYSDEDSPIEKERQRLCEKNDNGDYCI